MMKPNNRIVAFARLVSTIKIIYRNISVQRSFLQKNIQPVLNRFTSQNDGTLDASDFKKITQYYGLAVPAILGEAFCLLHNRKMSDAERRAATSQGAMTGLFDDFFDKQYLSDEMIELVLEDEVSPGQRCNEKLFLIFYRDALQHVPDKLKMRSTLKEVYHAQLESKKQVLSSITEKDIESITFYKGGASLLFYRSAFLPASSPAEEALMYNLGSLMQLANDIFDVYKDREAGIKTLVTEASHIDPIRKLLQQMMCEYFEQAYRQGLNEESVHAFLSLLSLGIFSRAFVCLDQLEQLEASTGNRFMVKQYTRKELICDMDTWRNKLRSARYHIQLSVIGR